MANHVSHAALPFPVKGARYTIPVPYLDADGDPTDPTTPDTEVSIDGAAFADCAEEVTTITGSNGVGYITLSGAETNASLVAVVAKVASGPKATIATLIPRVMPAIHSGTASAGSSTTITLQNTANAITNSAYSGLIIKTTGGTGGGGTGGANNQARVITDYVASTFVATVSPAWETTPDATTTYEVLRPDSIGYQSANVIAWAGTAVATPDTAGYPKVTVKSGSGTGEVSLSSGGVTLSTSGLGAVADAVFDEDITGHRAANSAGAMLQPLHSGACQAGGSGTTVVLASGASSANDYYNGDLLVGWVTADGTNKFADYITDYVGATRTATVTGIPVSPDATYTYAILPGGTIPGASAPSAADNAAAVWNAATASYVATGSFGERFKPIRRDTAQAGTTSSITLDASASATTDYYKFAIVYVLSGTGAGQARQITAYNGTTKAATVAPAFITAPSSDSEFVILPLGIDAVTTEILVDAMWDEPRSGHATAGSFGERVNANVDQISGDTTAADNAEAFFDGTGYAGTNNVIPTVTTLTGHTPQTGDSFARLGAPAGASVSADIAAVKVDSAAILVDTGTTLDTAIAAILADTGTDGVVVATASKSGYALSNDGIDALYTRQLTEAYAADGAAPTVAQALLQIQQMLTEFGISGTTMTVKKLDGTTTAFTLTLNDGSAPTALTRAT